METQFGILCSDRFSRFLFNLRDKWSWPDSSIGSRVGVINEGAGMDARILHNFMLYMLELYSRCIESLIYTQYKLFC